ncbi:exo-alpha-sialidase, partial [Trypanosoma cruzi]
MNGRRQEALTINMAREHAATPRRNTAGEDDRRKKQKAAQTHGRNKRQAGKASPRASPWPATPHQPSHIHTPSQCCQSAGERIRPSTQRRKTPPPINHQWKKRRSDTPPPTPAHSHSQRDAATAPQPTHSAQQASNHPKSHTRKRIL